MQKDDVRSLKIHHNLAKNKAMLIAMLASLVVYAGIVFWFVSAIDSTILLVLASVAVLAVAVIVPVLYCRGRITVEINSEQINYREETFFPLSAFKKRTLSIPWSAVTAWRKKLGSYKSYRSVPVIMLDAGDYGQVSLWCIKPKVNGKKAEKAAFLQFIYSFLPKEKYNETVFKS